MTEMIDDYTDAACEEHPWLAWPHGDCSGPGMPWADGVGWMRWLVFGLGRYISDGEGDVGELLEIAGRAGADSSLYKIPPA